jgi:hypothetical protein
MFIKEILLEKTVFDPDVSWVDKILTKVNFNKANGDLFILANMLEKAFRKQKIIFDIIDKPKFGKGIYREKSAAKTGILGAEYIGGDPEMVIYISHPTTKLSSPFPEFAHKLKQFIKHELIHKEQMKKSKLGHIGASPVSDISYYSDPYEISAIASEMESDLLQIEPDPIKLVNLLKTGDKKLHKSDRYRMYLHDYRNNPTLWKKAFSRMMHELISRIEHKSNS